MQKGRKPSEFKLFYDRILQHILMTFTLLLIQISEQTKTTVVFLLQYLTNRETPYNLVENSIILIILIYLIFFKGKQYS